MFIMVWRFGDITDLMELNKNYFRLEAGEDAKIEFTTYVPASAEVGKTYAGRVFLFKIPTFGL